MNPRELRIGNLFHDPLTKSFLKVIAIDISGRIVFDHGSDTALPDGWKAEPIPIESNINHFNLGKLGYRLIEVSRASDDSILQYVVEIGIEVIPGGTTEWSAITTVKFIHQLQNMVFALQGEELELKTVEA